MEKKVMVRLCAKILTEIELYDTDMEVRNLIDWICVSEQIKENNNTIWIVNTFLDNFFKVIFPILYWCLISQRGMYSVMVVPVYIIP